MQRAAAVFSAAAAVLAAVVLAKPSGPCNRSRAILTAPWGVVSHGPPGSNYTHDSHCEWLIRANSSDYFISLRFLSMGTECSYDYIFIYDGDSFNSTLLGSFSGKTEPQELVATSGYMLILLYSDTNYVLDGFRAEYSVTECRWNCSGRGTCITGHCVCEAGWTGLDCATQLCPDNCGAPSAGRCVQGRCACLPGFAGRACSLDRNDTVGNRWHWVYNGGLRPRVSHSAVYIKGSDSLYVFGGYDLNHVLGDLSIFRFNSSRWEDQDGNLIPDWTHSWSGEIDSRALRAVLDEAGVSSLWNLGSKSFLKNALLTIADNKTFPGALKSKVNRRVDNFKSSSSPTVKPSPRYAHAASEYPGGFVMYGGRLEDGSLSDELWHYDEVGGLWSLRSRRASTSRPPPLASGTLTLAHEGWLYLLGGALADHRFSYTIYKIRLFIVGGPEEWELVTVRGGKELDIRLVGHTTVYLSHAASLLVYGGIAATSRFSKLSDRMFSFSIETGVWAEIHYPRSRARDSFVPSQRAFHSSTVVGNYIVVFGGYTHRHNRDEVCYDNQIFLYHLGCHTWVAHDILGRLTPASRYPKRQGFWPWCCIKKW